MKIIPAAKFKERCLALIDSVDPEGILITKRGKPVARLLPVERSGTPLIGRLKGRIRLKGNLLTTGIPWKPDAKR